MARCCSNPTSVETHKHLSEPIMRHIRTLRYIALARSLAVARRSSLANAHQELGVALIQSQGYVFGTCALLLATAVVQQVWPEADTPLVESVEFCTEPVCWLCLLLQLSWCCLGFLRKVSLCLTITPLVCFTRHCRLCKFQLFAQNKEQGVMCPSAW
jgi:hypothetical protein